MDAFDQDKDGKVSLQEYLGTLKSSSMCFDIAVKF